MADPENFEEDLFADLYVNERTFAQRYAPVRVTLKAIVNIPYQLR
jgi:hypothetical protein